MAQLQSFEHEVADTTAPGFIMAEIGHYVCEGMKEANWAVPRLGALCTLKYFEKRRKNIGDESEILDQPHYLMYATYDTNGTPAQLLVRFIDGNDEPIKGGRAAFYRDPEGARHNFHVGLHPNEIEWVTGMLMQAGIERAEQGTSKWTKEMADAAANIEQPLLRAVPDATEG